MKARTPTTAEMMPPIERITLSALAREALAEFDGDVQLAKQKLVGRLENERWLLQAVADEAIDEAVNTFVQSAHRGERTAIVLYYKRAKLEAPKSKMDFSSVTKALSNTHKRMFLDFPLAKGLKLRDATKEQVQAQVQVYASQGETLLHRARWLERIAKIVKPGQLVGKSIDEAKVAKLYEESANV